MTCHADTCKFWTGRDCACTTELREMTAAAEHHEEHWKAQCEKVERELTEVRQTSRVLPCDGMCMEYPEEDCSLHGREPAELWGAIAAKGAEVDRLRATIARVEQLADEAERNESARYIHPSRLRAALADPEPADLTPEDQRQHAVDIEDDRVAEAGWER
jgi:hypothetical protein